MRTLAFDGRMGASGDMLLGALLALGADRDSLSPVEEQLDVRYDVSTTTRCGISATAVTVALEDDQSESPDGGGDGDHDHSHDGHAREHSHDKHANVSENTHSHGEHAHEADRVDEQSTGDGTGDASHGRPAEGAGPNRTYPEVVAIVESMDLPAAVERDALAIFELLGRAEASVHGTALESTHFHEVGADDAIADVVGVALLVDQLDPEEIVTTPLATGGGTVQMSHGRYPVPPPAVVELATAADWSLRGGPLETELLTPTGAAILAHFADGVESLPTLAIEESGYGAGLKSFDSHPNVLRALLGESTGELGREPITVLETHLDDATPETLGGLHETLSDAGALDVAVVPMTMKKSRPGHLVKVVVAPENASRVARTLATETGTLGVREHGSGHRFVAEREVRTVTLDIDGESFDVDVKFASMGEQDRTVFDVSGEYEDARAIAAETGLSIRAVLRRAETLAREE